MDSGWGQKKREATLREMLDTKRGDRGASHLPKRIEECIIILAIAQDALLGG